MNTCYGGLQPDHGPRVDVLIDQRTNRRGTATKPEQSLSKKKNTHFANKQDRAKRHTHWTMNDNVTLTVNNGHIILCF